MTTIIWDGVVMCADKQASENEGLQRTVTKIERVRGALVGFAGDFAYCLKMKYWWASGADPEKYPVPVGNEGGRLMVVDGPSAAPRIYLYEGPIPIQVEDGYCAIGSGREMASALLLYMQQLQCDDALHNPLEQYIAELVMDVVMTLDAGTGMGYDVLPLNEKEM